MPEGTSVAAESAECKQADQKNGLKRRTRIGGVLGAVARAVNSPGRLEIVVPRRGVVVHPRDGRTGRGLQKQMSHTDRRAASRAHPGFNCVGLGIVAIRKLSVNNRSLSFEVVKNCNEADPRGALQSAQIV